jgi:hypothetical protein
LLVDDCSEYVHPGQEKNWLPIEQFAPPYGAEDRELLRLLTVLRGKADGR